MPFPLEPWQQNHHDRKPNAICPQHWRCTPDCKLSSGSPGCRWSGLIYTGVPLLPVPAQRAAESPQPCVTPATCSNFTALGIARNYTNKSGFLSLAAARAFLAEQGIASLLLLSQKNAWGHGLAESFSLGSTQGISPTLGRAAPEHNCPLEVLEIQVPHQPQEQPHTFLTNHPRGKGCMRTQPHSCSLHKPSTTECLSPCTHLSPLQPWRALLKQYPQQLIDLQHHHMPKRKLTIRSLLQAQLCSYSVFPVELKGHLKLFLRMRLL